MSPSSTMKAIGFYQALPISDPGSLVDIEVEKPFPSGRDILVEVRAISVNPVDTKVRARGNGGSESAKIIGYDVSGVVVQVGSESTLFQKGDEVYYAGSLMRPGGNSEFHLVDERIVGRKPKSLNFAEAAALPLTALTAWEGLYDRFGLSERKEENRGKSTLLIGAAGGMGSIAVQLARLAGLKVIGTASRTESIQWAKDHGADHIINHHQEFAPQLKAIGIVGVDYIFCLNQTELHWENMAAVIAPQGKICLLVGSAKPIDLNMVYSKSVTVCWELMFTRSMFQTPDMAEQGNILNKVAALVDAGKVKTTLTERLQPINAANLRIAHGKIESGNTIGKIVLERFGE